MVLGVEDRGDEDLRNLRELYRNPLLRRLEYGQDSLAIGGIDRRTAQGASRGQRRERHCVRGGGAVEKSGTDGTQPGGETAQHQGTAGDHADEAEEPVHDVPA